MHEIIIVNKTTLLLGLRMNKKKKVVISTKTNYWLQFY